MALAMAPTMSEMKPAVYLIQDINNDSRHRNHIDNEHSTHVCHFILLLVLFLAPLQL